MADVRRWKVTYTKHLKQKRKIYHDGFLVLHSSINKVMLYDESETLLECRILKGEEAVGSGESLVFNAYLVDIGDPEGVLKASNGSKGSWMRRKEFKSPVSVGNQAGGAEINNAQKISLSPSQKLIREFKKREIHKYGSPPRNATSVEPSGAGTSSIFVSFTVENRQCSGLYVLEWQVLYTTSLTQKVKKYHDGFLRCQNSGVMSRQVMLFDESSKLLECRFLKKGEEVRSGETMEFQGHLVEIGECKENYKTFTVMDAGGSSCSSSRKLEMPKQKNDTNMSQSVVKVWQVLYTAQVTQKAKKYHDGFLQLATCGSFGRQLMLYDANWKLIDNKFLKKDEMIRSGAPVQFDSHLVDNLDSEWKEETLTDKSEQKTIFGDTSERKKGYGNLGCTRVNNSNGEVRAGAVKSASTNSGSYPSEKQESSQGILKDRPIRDALGILSILKKPSYEEGIAAECADKSVEGTVDSPNKRISESITCAVDSSVDNQTHSAVAPNAIPVEKLTVDTGIDSSTSMRVPAHIESIEQELTAGSAVDEIKIHGVESASNVIEKQPCFDLGF